MQHSQHNQYGENIYMNSEMSEDFGNKTVDAWYNEMAEFDLSDNENKISQHSGIRK